MIIIGKKYWKEVIEIMIIGKLKSQFIEIKDLNRYDVIMSLIKVSHHFVWHSSAR